MLTKLIRLCASYLIFEIAPLPWFFLVPPKSQLFFTEQQSIFIIRAALKNEIERALYIFAGSWLAAFFIAAYVIQMKQNSIENTSTVESLSYQVIVNFGVTKTTLSVPNRTVAHVVVVIVVYVLQNLIFRVFYLVVVFCTQTPLFTV